MAIPKVRKIGHAKFIFIYRDVKTSMFIMLDDGRVFLETFNSMLKTSASNKLKRTTNSSIEYLVSEKITTISDKLSKYLIDGTTDIVYSSDWEHYKDPQSNDDIIFNLLNFIRQFTVCSFRYVELGHVVLGIKNSFKSNKIIPTSAEENFRKNAVNRHISLRGFNRVTRYINCAYDYIFERKLCHWISEEFNEKINLMYRGSRQRMKILAVGLFYICVKAWNRANIKKICGYEQQHKNYVLKNIKIIEDD
jgi:hypothetical protein